MTSFNDTSRDYHRALESFIVDDPDPVLAVWSTTLLRSILGLSGSRVASSCANTRAGWGEHPGWAARAGATIFDVAALSPPGELLVVANDEFARRLQLVGPEDWRRPTPCSEWDVRALVNHVVGGNVRYQLLLHGAPTEEVEATRTVDHLGDDALASFVATANAVVACFSEVGALERVGHHASGDRTGRELLSMRILDAAIHAWDLARGIGADGTLDSRVVAFLLAYSAQLDLGSQQHSFAQAGVDVPLEATPQERLLHRLGRHP